MNKLFGRKEEPVTQPAVEGPPATEEEAKPESIYDLFADFEPKGKKREAIAKIGSVWDEMTPEERVDFFPGVSQEDAGKEWNDIGVKQPIYQQTFVKVFGDHKTPFE